METKKRKIFTKVLPMGDVMLIKVRTINKKIAGQIPVTLPTNIELFLKDHIVIGYLVDMDRFIFKEEKTDALVAVASGRVMGYIREVDEKLEHIAKTRQLFEH